MHLPTIGRRPFPVADRTRDGQLYETMHPRLAATRLLREKIADRDAGLDPYDHTIFILVARQHERAWAYRALELVGIVLNQQETDNDGRRFRAVIESDVRLELGLDSGEPPLMEDEPLASRAVDASPLDAILRVLPPARLRVVPVVELPPPVMRPAMEQAQHAAAIRVDCGCGAPAGRECRCTDDARLEAAAAHSREIREERWLAQQPNKEVH